MTIEQRRETLFKNLAGIAMLCELIKIYYINSIKDTRFRNPKIQSKADKIISFANSIQNKELGDAVRLKAETKEEMEDEHALQLWRIMDYFMFMPTDKLEEFADELHKIESKA